MNVVKMRIRKAGNIENTIFLGNGVSMVFTALLGIVLYRSLDVIEVIPSDQVGFIVQAMCVVIYIYISLWSVVGVITLTTLIVWLILWIMQCPSQCRRAREARRLKKEEEDREFAVITL